MVLGARVAVRLGPVDAIARACVGERNARLVAGYCCVAGHGHRKGERRWHAVRCHANAKHGGGGDKEHRRHDADLITDTHWLMT